MYSRQFKEPPAKIVQNGKAIFGTFLGVSPRLAIKGMRAPYAGVPLPAMISKFRIKSRLNYFFSIDKYIGMVEFFDFRVFGMAELHLWNKESGIKNVYHAVIPTRHHFIPLTTNKGICACYLRGRYMKFSWGRNHQHQALSFRLKGDSVRPDSEGFFFSPMDDDMHQDCMFVNPSPTSSRCSATWFSSMTVHGKLQQDKEIADESSGLAAMIMNRTYFKMHSISSKACGLGTIYKDTPNEKKIIFHLNYSNLDAADSDKNNDNILIVNGKPTTLPSVLMTHPFGLDKKWIIQDTESMVDLTFNPISSTSRHINVIAMRTTHNALYGTFDGVLLDSEGNKITLKNFPGIIDRIFLRSVL
ncbi:MAG: DUF2804 domain-containing protein [Treponema sp.]|nr:DUF2804 domain-containing protein [Treponema sp.]